MSLIQLFILFSISLIFFLLLKGALFLTRKQPARTEQIIKSIPFGIIFLTFVLLTLTNFFTSGSFSLALFILSSFAFANVILNYLTKNTVIQNIGTFLFAFSALFSMPQFNTTPFSFSFILYTLLASLLTLLFIKLSRIFDRIPLFSSFMLIVYFLGGYFLSTQALHIAPEEVSILSLALLVALPVASFSLKAVQRYSFGRPLIDFFAFFMGYIIVCLLTSNKAFVLPIYFSYQLFELAFAFVATAVVCKGVTSLRVPFLVEKALLKNIRPAKVLQKAFFNSLFLTTLACLSTKTNESKYILFCYIATALLLYSTYNLFQNWGKEQPKLRSLVSDLKDGLLTLENSVKEYTAQSNHTRNKSATKSAPQTKRKSTSKGKVSK